MSNLKKSDNKTEDVQIQKVELRWIDIQEEKPKTSNLVAVLIDSSELPTIAHYNKKFNQWYLENKEIKGNVIKWFGLPEYLKNTI